MAIGSSFADHLDKELLDPEFAALFLMNAMEEDDVDFLSDVLLRVVKVHGAAKVAAESGIARQALYKMLSKEGNPSYKNVEKILNVLGLEIVFQEKKIS